MPPSIPASLPASPDTKPVALVEPLPNAELGTLAVAHTRLIEQYGVLGVRFNTFRQFYDCVRKEVNEGKSGKGCL